MEKSDSMIDEKNVIKVPHNIILEDRKSLSISGVEDISSFDENMVVLQTEMGELTIRGYNLHISKTNIDTGELLMGGEICEFCYSAQQSSQDRGFFSRMFK